MQLKTWGSLVHLRVCIVMIHELYGAQASDDAQLGLSRNTACRATGCFYSNPVNYMWRLLKSTGIAPPHVQGAQVTASCISSSAHMNEAAERPGPCIRGHAHIAAWRARLARTGAQQYSTCVWMAGHQALRRAPSTGSEFKVVGQVLQRPLFGHTSRPLLLWIHSHAHAGQTLSPELLRHRKLVRDSCACRMTGACPVTLASE